jgi:cellobiose transport system permease protein
MYQQGWTYDHLGLASATAWTMFVIIVLAVLVNLGLARRREHRDHRDRTIALTGAARS